MDMDRQRPTGSLQLSIRIALMGILLNLIGCMPTKPPAVPDSNMAMTGAAAGLAAGAVVGSLSTGVSVPIAAAMGGIIGGAIGTAIMEKDPLLKELDRDHVQIIRMGEEVMLVLPTDYYFYPNSSHLNENLLPGLDNVAKYISQFETKSIKVAGYTDVVGSELRNLALSRQQAQNVANYLWNQGLDARMIYSIGYGCLYPIANNESFKGRSSNRRVQITFRYLPADVA